MERFLPVVNKLPRMAAPYESASRETRRRKHKKTSATNNGAVVIALYRDCDAR